MGESEQLMDAVDTELLTEDCRLALHYEEVPEEWLDLDGLGVYVLAPSDSTHLTRGALTADLDTVMEYHHGDREAMADAAMTHLTRNGYAATPIVSRGYSQRDWLMAIVYHDHDVTGVEEADRMGVLEDMLDTWQAWLWGDTYSLQVQRLVTYTANGYPDKQSWELAHDYDASALIATRKRYHSLSELAAAHGLNLEPHRERVSA